MPEFSLFSLFSKYLDPHLTFPLLEFMADRNVSRIEFFMDFSVFLSRSRGRAFVTVFCCLRLVHLTSFVDFLSLIIVRFLLYTFT